MEINKEFGIHNIVQMLHDKKPFAFSRFGDGEWNAILDLRGPHQANINGEQNYFDDLRQALRDVLLKKPDYIMGLQGLANRTQGAKIQKFLDNNNLSFDWVNSDIFHHASIKGYLGPFIEALKKEDVYIIGPEYLENLSLFLFTPYYVPSKNCWLKFNQIFGDLLRLVRETTGIMLFCAGMTTNVLIQSLWTMNNKWTYIDVGSVFDPYAGQHTRSYHKTLKI